MMTDREPKTADYVAALLFVCVLLGAFWVMTTKPGRRATLHDEAHKMCTEVNAEKYAIDGVWHFCPDYKPDNTKE